MRTTDSDHDQPIFRDRRQEVAVDGPDRLWVADLTYVAIATGFVYVVVILDAWSRRVVGYAIGRTLDARLTVAALRAAIERHQPPSGCVHHSDRGWQYAARIYRERSWRRMASSARWGAAPILTTTPRLSLVAPFHPTMKSVADAIGASLRPSKNPF